MPHRVNLNDLVRPGQRVAQEDLGQVRFALSRLGLFDPARDPSGGESLMGAGMRRALGAFQAGQGLREDATLRPRGPTEECLNLLLEQNRGLRAADPGDGLALDRQAARERTPGALVGRVGPGLENHPDDVRAVSTVLRRLGVLKPGTPNPNKTGPVFGGLKNFQRQNGLARDATITPDGPTEQLLAQSLSEGGRGLPSADGEIVFRTPEEPGPRDRLGDGQHPGSVRPPEQGPRPRPKQTDEPTSSPQLSSEQRESLQLLDRFTQIDRGEPLDSSADPVGTAFILREFANANPEERARKRDFHRQRAEPAVSGDPRPFERTHRPPQTGGAPVAGFEFLEMFRAAKAGDLEARRKLNVDLARILLPARKRDDASDVPNVFLGGLLSEGEAQHVPAFIESLIALDPKGLGRELGFLAQNVNLGLNVAANSPEEAIGDPRAIKSRVDTPPSVRLLPPLLRR